jgi:ribonuclease BN (tRNA processing enzyme)
MSATSTGHATAGDRTTGLELTVLACEAGRSSGYLLRHGTTAILIDCGPGVIRALEDHADPASLTAVVATHQHADHCLDLLTLACRLRYPDPAPSLPLYVPAPMQDLLASLDHLFGTPTIGQLHHPIADSFDLTPLHLEDRPAIDLTDSLTMTAFPARHAVASAALRFQADTGSVAFSSDTGPTDALCDAARDASLFVCEATYGPHAPAEDSHGHLSAYQGAQLATQAHACSLLLTHLSRPSDAGPSLAAASSAYAGPIEIAVRSGRYQGLQTVRSSSR